ncbi:MAG: elongation factor P [Erythrobacter sp.]
MIIQTRLKRAALLAVPVLLGAALTAPAHADGMLKTMPHGRYHCSLPGDAASTPRILLEPAHFRIASASSYRSDKGRGTYIMKGKVLTFTRGPKNGERYKRVGDSALQKLDADGKLSRLLCSRVGAKLER